MAQDSTLDNLRHAPGTDTAAFGTLGRVTKIGSGGRAMVLIPGLGFGGDVWDDFARRHAAEYTMYAVTLPGFGGTAPYAMPRDPTAFATTPWFRSAVAGVVALIEREQIRRVTVVAHWAFATQIAFRLALDHPDRIEGVIVIGGALRSYFDNVPGMLDWTSAQRVAAAEGMARQWFRTVTRQTWDDNNFMSYDYAVNPRRGLFLWRDAQSPTLAVWIRYLVEFYATDVSQELSRVTVPMLVVQPAFDDPAYYVEEGRNYMRNLCIDSWRGVAANALIDVRAISGSRLFVMYDQPDALSREITHFFARLGAGR